MTAELSDKAQRMFEAFQTLPRTDKIAVLALMEERVALEELEVAGITLDRNQQKKAAELDERIWRYFTLAALRGKKH